MRVTWVCVWVLSALWACSGEGSPADILRTFNKPETSATSPLAWYDPKPLLSSLRPSMHQALETAVAPRTLDQLPLYDMGVDIDLGSARYTLTQMLWWTNTEATPMPDLAFRIYANTAATLASKDAPVRFIDGRCPEDPACVIAQPAPDLITVTPSAPIASLQHFRVELRLEGKLTRIDSARTNMLTQGLESLATMGSPHGHGDYGLLAVGDGVASLANFYPMLAPRRFGRWVHGEENLLGDLGSDDLCHVRARVTVDPGVELVSVGTITQRDNATNGRTQISVVAGAVREMALLASRQLRSASVTVNDTRVTSYYLASDSAAGLRALDITKSALEIFQRRFGEYPYTELDVVEAAMIGGAGGVEFSGLFTVASMLYRPMAAGAGPLGALLKGANPQAGAHAESMREAMFEFVVAHEVAHQYWHVLVGSDSREHPFADEALAQHSAVVYLEDRYGAERAARDESMQVANGFRMMRSMGHGDGAVDRPVAAFGAPIEYAGLVYGKGPMVYRALRDQTGEDGFFEAARKYVKDFRFRTAPQRGLIDTVASRGRAIQVRNIAAHWLEEAHGDEDLGALDHAAMMGQAAGDAANADPNAPAMPALGGADMGQMMQMLQGLQAGDSTGGGRLGHGTGLKGSGRFDNNGLGDNDNGAGPGDNGQVDPEMQEIMKTLPGGGTGTPDLNQLLQQMQQMQQPHGT